jgi:hypothetical protein
MELREQYEAAEARERADREGAAEDDAEEVEESAEGGDEAEGDEEAAAPVVKKKKPAAVKEPSKRKKPAKAVPQRVVWVIYDNSYKKVGKSYTFNQKHDAEEEAERLRQEKKTTYFVQMLKENIT